METKMKPGERRYKCGRIPGKKRFAVWHSTIFGNLILEEGLNQREAAYLCAYLNAKASA